MGKGNLEDRLRGSAAFAGNAAKLHKIVTSDQFQTHWQKALPLFQGEDLQYHLEEIIAKYEDVRRHVPKMDERNENYLLLKRTAEELYGADGSLTRHKFLLWTGKAIDSYDQCTALVEIGTMVAGVFTGAGVLAAYLASWGENVALEWAPKITWALTYSALTKDYESIWYFAKKEFKSALLGPVGEATIGMKNLYINRERDTFQYEVADLFMERLRYRNVAGGPIVNATATPDSSVVEGALTVDAPSVQNSPPQTPAASPPGVPKPRLLPAGNQRPYRERPTGNRYLDS